MDHFAVVMNPESSPDPNTVAEYKFVAEMTPIHFMYAPDPPSPTCSGTRKFIVAQKLNRAKDEYGVNAEMMRGAAVMLAQEGSEEEVPSLLLRLFHDLYIDKPWIDH